MLGKFYNLKLLHARGFEKEWIFKVSTSGGPGGQHVNKVATKVHLFFDVQNSIILNDEEKLALKEKLKNYLDKAGILQIQSQTKRSQLANKEVAIRRFFELLLVAFEPQKLRMPTKLSKVALQKRKTDKQYHSQQKQLRRFDPLS